MPTKTTVTGLLQDAGGNIVTSGNVMFTVASGADEEQFYRVTGTAVIVPSVVNAIINASGQIKAEDGVSALQIWGNDTLTPANSWYRIKFAPVDGPVQITDFVLISGASYDVSNPTFYDPGISGGPVDNGHIFFVTGVPLAATGTNGDLAIRIDGGAMTTIYQRRVGAWVAIV